MNTTNGEGFRYTGVADACAALGELGEAFAAARSPAELAVHLSGRFRRLVDSDEAWLLWPGSRKGEISAWRLTAGEGPSEWTGAADEDLGAVGGCPAGLVRLYGDLKTGEAVRLAFGAPDIGDGSLLVKLPVSGNDAVASMPILKALRGLLAMAFQAIHKGALLSRGKAEWEKAFDAASDLFVIHDPHGTIFRANMAVSRFAGIPIRGCVGSACGHLFPGMCTDSDATDLEWSHPQSGRVFRVSTQVINLSGRKAVLHVLHEITQERNLASLASERQKIDLTKNMLQGIAHEIRNPLFGISTVMQALQARYAPDNEVSVYINTVLTEVTRLDRVVRRFLQMAFMDDHTPPYKVGVSDLVQTAVGLLRGKDSGYSPERMVLKLPPSDLVVNVHKETLADALSEIMENALALEGGATTLTVEVHHGNGKITLSLSDNGPGIPSDHLVKVFEPFFTTRPHRTGLGLSLAKAAIMRDGGTVEARRNAPFPGATFLVTLPLVPM